MSEKPTNHQVYVAARIGYIGVHPDFIETKAQRDRAREYDEMIAEVEREAAARALEEAADEIESRRNVPGLVYLDVRYAGYYTGIRSGMESDSKALRARAAEIRSYHGHG